MIAFWDTNILIDLLCEARENHHKSLQILSISILKKHDVVLTSLTLANACYILRKHHDIYDFENRFIHLRAIIDITVMDNSQADIALQAQWPDFEDALQYESAVANGCDIIITRDKKGFLKSKITVLNPEEFIDEHK